MEDLNKFGSRGEPGSAEAPARPVTLEEVGSFEFIRWPDGGKQLVKNTYNPREQKNIRQHISVTNRGDAVHLAFLLREIVDKWGEWGR